MVRLLVVPVIRQDSSGVALMSGIPGEVFVELFSIGILSGDIFVEPDNRFIPFTFISFCDEKRKLTGIVCSQGFNGV